MALLTEGPVFDGFIPCIKGSCAVTAHEPLIVE